MDGWMDRRKSDDLGIWRFGVQSSGHSLAMAILIAGFQFPGNNYRTDKRE